MPGFRSDRGLGEGPHRRDFVSRRAAGLGNLMARTAPWRIALAYKRHPRTAEP